MGLTQKLGTIPLAIQTDSSNNVGIGANPISSTKFYVLGNTTNYGITSENPSGYGGLTLKQISGNSWSLGVTSNNLFFYDANGGATRMTLTGAGNVGIGTSSPTCTLEVARNNGGSTGGQIALRNSSSSTLNSTTEISFLNDTGASASGTRNGRIISQMENVGNGASNMQFWTWSGSTDAERMRITSGGNVGIGITNPTTRLFVSHAAAGYVTTIENNRNVNGDLNTALTLGNNCNNTSSYFLVCSMGIGDRMYIYGNGNIVNINNSYGVLSDVKLKENIVDATPKLENLLKVKIRNYNLIGEETKQIGVIAQELEEIFPSMVDETEDFKEIEVTDEQGNITKERQSLGTTTKSVKMSVFVPMLIKAMQEQQEIINQLSAKVTALEQKA